MKSRELYCPICNYKYEGKRFRTKHHLFPRYWYHSGVVVYACAICHTYEFHKMFPMNLNKVWTRSECIQNWVKFCKIKGRNAYIIYPKLMDLSSLN